jgi:hypothetical protein
MYLVNENNSKELVLYIEYRSRIPVKAITITEQGNLNTWQFQVDKNVVAGMVHILVSTEPRGNIKALEPPKVKSDDQFATYWMLSHVHFKKRGRAEIVPKNIVRIENPHKLRTVFGERTVNPFEFSQSYKIS